MNQKAQVEGLSKLSDYIKAFLTKEEHEYSDDDGLFYATLKRSEIENPWFTIENQRYALQEWAEQLTAENLEKWLKQYRVTNNPKKVGLILAGNIPMVGFHDVVSVILSGHIPMIKFSSKDIRLLPFLLNKWDEFSSGNIIFEVAERLAGFDAVIATGSNNTARYLEYYFKDQLSIIRKNRTSVAVLRGDESEAELELLAEDIFRYFGLGCRNVTRLFLPADFLIDRLFESFISFKDVINHNKYANNYEYNRAIYLLNQEKFWDNNFVMLKEDENLFSPLSVINVSRYDDIAEVEKFLAENSENIQTVVAKPELGLASINFGETQHPSLSTYADHVDTMRFLEVI